jgi:hypothetical protein
LRERALYANQDFSFGFQTDFEISVIQSQQLAKDHITEMHLASKFCFQMRQTKFFASYLSDALQSPKKRMNAMDHDTSVNSPARRNRVNVHWIPVSGDFRELELIFKGEPAGA